jgi:hypothetical protein
MVFDALFLGDRLGSLTLGVPYSLSEASGREIAFPVGGAGRMYTGIAYVAGRIVDQVQSGGTAAAAMLLDGELLQLAERQSLDYWNLEVISTPDALAMGRWQQRAMEQLTFYNVRMVLHLPEMLKGANGHEPCRTACFQSARQLLSTFRKMRAPETEAYYQSKANDFYALFAAMTLIIGILGYGDVNENDADWVAIDETIEILRRASTQPFGRVARQSYEALQALTRFRGDQLAIVSKPVRVVMPFFGAIVVSMAARSGSQSESAHEPIAEAAAPVQITQGREVMSEGFLPQGGLFWQPADADFVGNARTLDFTLDDWSDRQAFEFVPDWGQFMDSIDFDSLLDGML